MRRFKRQTQSDIGQALVPSLAMALGARGFSMSEATAQAVQMVQEAEQESRASGGGNPPGYGDAFLEQVKRGDPPAVAAYRVRQAEGVTDEDIRWYWNMTDVEKRVLTKLIELDRMALFLHVMDEEATALPQYTQDRLAQLAAERIRKVHPTFGDPADTTHGSGQDRPLYPELKDRIDSYIENAFPNIQAVHEEAVEFTSFNAWVRAKMQAGQL